jgi:hypothetical protein
MSDSYKQYSYTGPTELWDNFTGRYTTLTKTPTGVFFNSSSDKNAKVSGMLLASKVQGYKYKTYIVKVIAAALTPGAEPYIYTGFSQAVGDREIIGPANYLGEYNEYIVKFILPETRLFDVGVLFSQKNITTHSVAVNSLSLYCVEDDFYVLTHKDTEIDSIKNFTGDSITAKTLNVNQINSIGESSITIPNILCQTLTAQAEVIVGGGGLSVQGSASITGNISANGLILNPDGIGITGPCDINIAGIINCNSIGISANGSLELDNGDIRTSGGAIYTSGGSIITGSGSISTGGGSISIGGGSISATTGNFTTVNGTVSANSIISTGTITIAGIATINNLLTVNPTSIVKGLAINGAGKCILYNGLNLNGPLTVIDGTGATGVAGSSLCVKGITGISNNDLTSNGYLPLWYNPTTGILAYNTGP